MLTGRDVRRLRSGLGLSQETCARLLGVSVRTWGRWEARPSAPLETDGFRRSAIRALLDAMGETSEPHDIGARGLAALESEGPARALFAMLERPAPVAS